MNLELLQSILNSLSEKRPVFHNEADFQHALAWEIREHYIKTNLLEKSYPKIRLEKRQLIKLNNVEKEINVDVVVELDESTAYFLETKYCTAIINNQTIKGELYHLKEQLAQNIRCYDFFKDISRLEYLTLKEKKGKGYAIFLTNETTYWKNSGRIANYDNFKIFDGRSNVKGKLIWRNNESPGTSSTRDSSIKLLGEYHFEWKSYGR